MAGIKKGRFIQLGLETVSGTAVAATALWRGLGVPEDLSKFEMVDEDIGYISGVDRLINPQKLAGFKFEATPATFEQLPYIGAAGIKNVVTGVADGAGTGKIYDYIMHSSAASLNTLKTYTLEGGDNQQCEEIEYGFVEAFELSGKANEAWMVSADWKGRQVTATTKTGAIAVPTVEEILFNKSMLYIDAIGGTIGTTNKANTLLEATLSVKTGLVPVFAGDGQLYFSFTKAVEPEVTLDITFEHDSIATAQKAIWLARTAQLFRIRVQGSTLGTPGTAYTYKTLHIDLAGKYTKFAALSDQDGNDVIKATVQARYNATATKFFSMLVVNELTALT